MNGEVMEMCRMTAAVKKAMRSGQALTIAMPTYIQNIYVTFLKSHHRETVDTITKWYAVWKSSGLADIKFLMPLDVADRHLLGFANMTSCCMVCLYKKYWKTKATVFTADWRFDEKLQGWNVYYQEQEGNHVPFEELHLPDPSRELAAILKTIGDFAVTIELPGWKKVFDEALGILKGTVEVPAQLMLDLPPKHQHIFAAAAKSDVFGAMGSWNDSPPYYAHEKGLDEEYEAYSAELLKQLRRALIYAINEW